jgi:hypothetical protein
MHLHHLWLDFLNVRKNIINLKSHFRQGSNEIEQSYWMRVINWTLGPRTKVQDQKVANQG